MLREASRKARKSRFDFKRKTKQFDNTLDDGSDAQYSRMSCLTFGITKSLNARRCYPCFAKLFRFYIRIAKHEIRNFILNSFHKSYFLSLSHVNCSRRIIFLFYVQWCSSLFDYHENITHCFCVTRKEKAMPFLEQKENQKLLNAITKQNLVYYIIILKPNKYIYNILHYTPIVKWRLRHERSYNQNTNLLWKRLNTLCNIKHSSKISFLEDSLSICLNKKYRTIWLESSIF